MFYLGRGWGVGGRCWGPWTGQFVEARSYKSVPTPEPRKLQNTPEGAGPRDTDRIRAGAERGGRRWNLAAGWPRDCLAATRHL